MQKLPIYKFTLYRLISSMTHDKKHQAILRQVTIDNIKKEYIEIWEQERCVKNYDLAALNIHGEVYTNGNLLESLIRLIKIIN